LLHLVRENRLDIHDIPVAEITEQYLSYIDVMKALNLDIAGEFLVRPLLGRDVFVRDFLSEEIPEGEVTITELSLADLISAFKDVLENMPKGEAVEIFVDRLSMADAIAFLLDRLKEEGAIRFDRLAEEFTTRNEILAFFLGILELIRLRTVKAYQAIPMGLITIVPAVREGEDGTGTEDLDAI
jgi:segregation and condensation protein A